MRATGIVRRVDDSCRIIIPRVILLGDELELKLDSRCTVVITGEDIEVYGCNTAIACSPKSAVYTSTIDDLGRLQLPSILVQANKPYDIYVNLKNKSLILKPYVNNVINNSTVDNTVVDYSKINTDSIERRMDDIGRIVIPRAFREKLGLNDYHTMKISIKDGIIVMKPVNNK